LPKSNIGFLVDREKYSKEAKVQWDHYREDVKSWRVRNFGHLKRHPKMLRRRFRRPDAPKRSLTSFFLFKADVDKQIKLENPHLKRAEILKLAGNM